MNYLTELGRRGRYLALGLSLATTLGCAGLHKRDYTGDPWIKLTEGKTIGRVQSTNILSYNDGEGNTVLRAYIKGDEQCGEPGRRDEIKWAKERDVIEKLREDLKPGNCIEVPYRQVGETRVYSQPKILETEALKDKR